MIPITRPTLPPYEEVESVIREIYASGLITNGKHVRAAECYGHELSNLLAP